MRRDAVSVWNAAAAIFRKCMRMETVSYTHLLMLLYLAFASAMAYTIWSQLLKYNPVSRVAVFCFMTPVFGVILSAVLLHESEQISLVQGAVALILITAGIVISHRERQSLAGHRNERN